MRELRHVCRPTLQWVLVAIMSLGSNGCSIIGYMTGQAIDDASASEVPASLGIAMSIQPGEKVRVTQKDSIVVEGDYREIVPLDSSVYSQRYENFANKARPSLIVPKFGEQLLISTKSGELRSEAFFRGFGNDSWRVLVRSSKDSHAVDFGFPQLTSIRNLYGMEFDLKALQSMSAAGEVPRDASLVMEVDGSDVRIPLDDILNVVKPKKRVARWVGLGAGLVVDVIVISQLASFRLFPRINLFGSGKFW